MSYIFDKNLELRDVADGAEVATAAEAGITVPVRKSDVFRVVFNVTALDETTGDETYVLSVETDSVAAFTDAPVEVARVTVTENGVYPVALDSKLIAKLDPNAEAIRVKATLAGTTPSITYGAFITPLP